MKTKPSDDQDRLFSPEEMLQPDRERKTSLGEYPVWTNNKARFISLYLKYFVLITKHGTYIDGFAGPQDECDNDAWAAKLVLGSKPQWLRNFHLCDAKRTQLDLLQSLVAAQPTRDDAGKLLYRTIALYKGDFNETVDEVLAAAKITEKEATFCLLDQRTFECDWSTVTKLAKHKAEGNKIELFYFLASSWFDRALSGQKDLEKLARWWGREDWKNLGTMTRDTRKETLVERFKNELGYQSAKAYPIYERQDGGAVMYYMIHATDHPDGPLAMARAYRNTVRPDDPYADAQSDFGFADNIKEPETQQGTRASLTA